MKKRKIMALLLAVGLFAGTLAGCTASDAGGSASSKVTGSSASSSDSGMMSEDEGEEIVDLEIWGTNVGLLPVDKGSPLYDFYVEKIGVGVIQPYVEWNGGETYQQQLNLKIASGEMPDIFLPVNGMEAELARTGAIMDLTDLIPEKAPNIWNVVPQSTWETVRSYDPNDEGRIYFVPNIIDYTLLGGMIRRDWLDNLGLSMPETQEDFVAVLRAFRDDDPNQNGIQDEIPTGGRQQAKWMDHLFGMYGLAMWEGDPQWDVYDGELTYSAVTPNMKDALQFISELYAEGLMDPETLLNDKASWEGKINSDKVGIYYHWAESVRDVLEAINNSTGVHADYVILPAISAPGYEGFYTTKYMKSPQFVVKQQSDPARLEACMRFLNAYGDESMFYEYFLGVEGMHYEVVDGVPARLPEDKTREQNLVVDPYNAFATLDFKIESLEKSFTEATKWMYDQSIRNVEDLQQYGKHIAGDGVPSNIYENYPDIQNKTLYVEYASKIITGEYPIEKFDEFVEKWNATGGDAVTAAAREWYEKVS